MKQINLQWENSRVPFCFGVDCLDSIYEQIAALEPDRILLVADARVAALHGSGFQRGLTQLVPVKALVRPPGESMKTLDSLAELAEEALAWGVTRRSVVVALGGGVPGNLAGLLSALLFRGIRLVHCPTTLMAVLDSTISFKQAVNSQLGKNLLGTYHEPVAVLANLNWLETLPLREWRSGLCEVVKNALAIRPAMIPRLLKVLTPECRVSDDDLTWLIEQSVGAKTDVMSEDRFERRSGLVLEYGHTLGHAIELEDHRLRGANGLSHGESVGVGMILAARIAETLGLLGQESSCIHGALLDRISSPTRVPPHLAHARIIERVKNDNKRGYLRVVLEGTVAMVLLRGPGDPAGSRERPLTPVSLSVVRDVLKKELGPSTLTRSALTVPAKKSHPKLSPRSAIEVVGVVVVTCGRKTLRDAVLSIFEQRQSEPIEIVVLGDDCPHLPSLLRGLKPPPGMNLQWAILSASGTFSKKGTVPHVARLRNVALALLDTPLFAFLDDDNRWEPNHLSSLRQCMGESRAPAVHSWRQLRLQDGKPWIPDVFPWLTPRSAEERKLFSIYRRLGVFSESNVLRDAVSLPMNGRDYGMVDMGEWLLRREVLAAHPFVTKYSDREARERIGEDDKLLDALRRYEVSTACSRQATLIYHLGGFSNGLGQVSQESARAGWTLEQPRKQYPAVRSRSDTEGTVMTRRSLAPTENTAVERNRALSRREFSAGAIVLRSRPRALFVELTRYCNLSCPMCRNPRSVPRSERMSEALYAYLEQELFPTADLIDLRGWGESLILPEFPDRARRAARQGAKLRIVSNMSFRRDDVLSLLAELGFYVGISIDTAAAELLAILRRGARLDLIERNARVLSQAYEARGIADRLNLYVTCQRPALDSLENIVTLAARVGVYDIRLAPVTTEDTSCLALAPASSLLREALERTAERGHELGVRVTVTASLTEQGARDDDRSTPACLHPWDWCYITWDGRIGFCDHLIGPHGDPYILGYLTQTPFDPIWNGPEWVALRAEHVGRRRTDAPRFAECAWCYRNRYLDSENLLEPSLESKRQGLDSLLTVSRGSDV